ncbi:MULTISPECIES: DUF6421 family protein [Microbacterium]|jgi:hypothetical protein|uniref:DUF6421 family protein n=1 Tax=Microbacterium TaxID=33882 RepID=UPI0006295C1E|nr:MULTISPECIES: DUF6421 family protein [Microbacterium]KAB1893385.1 hypothetical protein F6W69_04950 [Microbacterium oxydans]KKX98192.1 hypothetical protein AAY78_07765 [Microbacterium sp. Ag1]NYF27113.1 hypothetical protein [Microbacterium sp. JAI119]RBO73457.1 hypothetical protein DSP71_05220 [Microbacterium sp. H6]GED37865.1 hypothetical protein MOX01_10070 [Microbacterium oxydans]
MSLLSANSSAVQAIVGEPEVVEDASIAEQSAAWAQLKDAAIAIREMQIKDGSIPDAAHHAAARELVGAITAAIRALAPAFPHDAEYLAASVVDFERWVSEDFGVPDFLDSLVAFQPQQHRVDGIRHLVVFPMYTQNGSSDRLVEALIVETIWPEFIAALEAGDYGNKLFVSLRLVDFTPGYDTNSAVLFPETVAMREIPTFTWGAIFQDREAARYRRVTRAAAEITNLDLPERAAAMLDDQQMTEKTFVMWDIIHDRTHMRGDLPFDPFMIKQRMPFFLYSLEEMRCDMTAFRESVKIERALAARIEAGEELTEIEQETHDYAHLVQYAVIFDRIFRFSITGTRTRNYDAVGGQLLFAWLHQRGVLHWTDTALAFDWDAVPDAVVALGDAIDDLYWHSIDRPKVAHWLAAYELVRGTLTPHPASQWARGLSDEILAGAPKGYTDAVMDDEFPLSMFFETLDKKMKPVIESTVGIRGTDD